jgi:hypothetical protein
MEALVRDKFVRNRDIREKLKETGIFRFNYLSGERELYNTYE